MPVYAYARLVFSWGFSVRPPGLSAGGPSFQVPPPSTLVGALAAGAARVLGWSEHLVRAGGRRQVQVYSPAYLLARHLLAAGAVVWGPVVLHRDVVRYSTLPYQSAGNIKDPAQWFGAQNYGLSMAAGAEAELVLVFDDGVLDLLGGPGALRAAAASIHRLGTKESLVSVVEAGAGEAREGSGGETCLYAPEDSVEEGEYYTVTVWHPKAPEAYTRSSPFAIPLLTLAVPGRVSVSKSVYLPPDPSGCEGLLLRDDAPAYTGDWPGRLGAVAALPPLKAGGRR